MSITMLLTSPALFRLLDPVCWCTGASVTATTNVFLLLASYFFYAWGIGASWY